MKKKHIMSVRRKCFAPLARLRKVRDVLPTGLKKTYNTLVLPHLD